VIVVTKEATATIRGLADLPSADRIVIGTPELPIGRYALQILDRAAASLGPDFRARVEARVVSRELNVRQVLAKVSLGEAQAGIVYRTDAKADPALTRVPIPPELNVIAEYPIAVVQAAPHPGLARAWVELVLSAVGKRALEGAGFVPAAVR
jgi:molybdate transport system substrate-binding protein